MARLDAARDLNARADAWLRERPAVWFAIAVLVPGLAVTATYALVFREPLVEGVIHGTVFGVVYASLTLYWNRR